MTPNHLRIVASATFEAARKVDVLPDGHRCRELHGHSFSTSIFASLPSGFEPFPGGAVATVQARLLACVERLNYKDLNRILKQPTDENLARWIRAEIDVPGIDRVAILSTPVQGVDLDRHSRAHVWRRFRFQAAHQLPRVPQGHKCGRMHGHGFEAILHANHALGSRAIGINYDDIDKIWAPIHQRVNYRCLNDIPGLENPTSENLAAWIFSKIKPVFPELSWVTVFETGSCGANFDGSRYRIWKEFSIDSAVQFTRAPPGSERYRLHGHTYTLRLHLEAPLDAVMGWTVDYGDVKAIFDPIYRSLDHHLINELPGLDDGDVVSLATWIFTKARAGLPALYRIDLHETPGTGCTLMTLTDGPAMPV